jgi:hypothetical protein
VIGFPKTGKTTLITAVFAYLFKGDFHGLSIVPRGDETIKRINKNIEQLELGRSIAPTMDQDVFAYRAEVVLPSLVGHRRYKLEIGDFPGEHSIQLAEQYGDWFHDTPYFQWAIDSDAFLFVIDVAATVADDTGEYVARQKRAFRAAWQRLEERHLDRRHDLAASPLILVFTKADALFPIRDPMDLPSVAAFDQDDYRKRLNSIVKRYDDLLQYLDRTSYHFSVAFTSIYMVDGDERLGIREVAHAVLPAARRIKKSDSATPPESAA